MRHLLTFAFALLTLSAAAQDETLLNPKSRRATQIVAVQTYPQGNDMNRQNTYAFNADGTLASRTTQGFGGQHTTRYPQPDNTTHRYDEKGLVDSAFSGATLQSRTVKDLDGDITETHIYKPDGHASKSIFYIYRQPNVRSTAIEYNYDADGCLRGRTLYRYDKHNRLTRIQQMTADEDILMTEQDVYDKMGNRTKRTRTFFEDGRKKSQTVEQYKYTYDSDGNWIRCEYYNDGRLYYTTLRRIEYAGSSAH